MSINDPVRVLVVGNDWEYEQMLRTLIGRLRLSQNLEAAFLHTVADARRAIGSARVDVLLSDFLLPDGTSADLLRSVKEHSPDVYGIILTGRPVEEFAPRSDTSSEIWPKESPPGELRRRMERLLLMSAFVRSSRVA